MSEVQDMEAGRCYVLLSDGDTWDEVTDCVVRFVTQEQDDEREWGDRIEGYRDISVADLVKHYLETKG